MKHFLKAAAITVMILIVLLAVNVICNVNGHELDAVMTGTVASIGALLIDSGLTRHEKNRKS